MRRKLIIGAAAGVLALGAVGAGAGIALADDEGDDDRDDSETPIEGADLERAERAALDHTGGGEVTDTETGDEESHYEVEVTLEDGNEVDVQLDESFQVVGSEEDGADDAAEDEGTGDDD